MLLRYPELFASIGEEHEEPFSANAKNKLSLSRSLSLSLSLFLSLSLMYMLEERVLFGLPTERAAIDLHPVGFLQQLGLCLVGGRL